jgi:transmembrane sensor
LFRAASYKKMVPKAVHVGLQQYNMKHNRITLLISRIADNSISEEDLNELKALLNQPNAIDSSDDGFDLWLQEKLEILDLQHNQQTLKHQVDGIMAVDRPVQESFSNPVRRLSQQFLLIRKLPWVAALLVIGLGSVAYLWLRDSYVSNQSIEKVYSSDFIEPAKGGTVLTLEDGTEILLDRLANGIVAEQGGTQVVLSDQKLKYEPSSASIGIHSINTIRTSKGTQHHVTLPDGSLVWMNAASSIRFATTFEKERIVTVTGEVYFDVVKNASIPFQVQVDGKAKIEVLGTSFNVNAYESQKVILATLIEGSVRVQMPDMRNQGQQKVVLKPRQQIQIKDLQTDQPKFIVADDANISKVLAWKNGLFDFDGVSIQEAMAQLERWYDIEVEYEKQVPSMKLMGKMTRGVTLNGLLEGLAQLGLNYRLEGRKLIILP